MNGTRRNKSEGLRKAGRRKKTAVLPRGFGA